ARREACRSPGRAADEVRSRPQSYDRQGARPDDPGVVPAARRRGDRTANAYTVLDPGQAILKTGRLMLVVPEAFSSLRAEHLVIGWKDTPEPRRAMRDALPFLQQATRVTIVEGCGPGDEKTAGSTT